MAVAVATITPADGAVNIYDGTTVDVELTDTSDMDTAKVEIIVNGESCTVANGLLEYWNNKAISGGAIVDSLQDLWFGARVEWYAGELQTITVEVVYDSVSISTTTFTTYTSEGFGERHADSYYLNFTSTPEWLYGSVTSNYNVIDLAPSLVTGDVAYVVSEDIRTGTDGFYWVARIFFSDGPAAGIAGELAQTDGPGAGTVEGWALTHGPAAGIVQAPVLLHGPASGVVGVLTETCGAAAGIVGTLTTTNGAAAAIVYAVNARNTVEIRTVSAAESALLTALGITVS